MEKRLIARGLLAGVVGSVLAFIFARLCAEPVIARAIAFEDGRTDIEEAHGVHEHGTELFTRGVQSTPGLGFGVLLFGVAMGALFSVLFCVVYARSKDVGPRLLSVQLALAAFVAVYLVPFLKYPPNPPAVGQADTISLEMDSAFPCVELGRLVRICDEPRANGWYQLVSGGEAPSFVIVGERKSWADFAPLEKSVRDVLTATYGQQTTDATLKAMRDSTERIITEANVYRQDLSYEPK